MDSTDELLTDLLGECQALGALPDVAALARAHGVAPLLNARTAEIDSFRRLRPDWLDRDRDVAQAQHLQAVRTLRKVAQTVDSPFLAFKGPTLARWYGEAGLRSFSDLDLLVGRHDFGPVLESLVAAGFRELSSNWHGFREHEVAEVPLDYQGSWVDLHWHLIATGDKRHQFRLDVPAMMDRAELMRLGDIEVLTLDRSDTLLHLCLGSGLAGGRRLLQLADVDRLIRHGEVEWAEFVRRADAAGARAVCAAVLSRCRRLLGTPVPDRELTRLGPYPGWRLMNDLVAERRFSAAKLQRGVGTGLLLSLGRDSATSTARALRSAIPELARSRYLGTALTQAGGPLDWQRPSPDPVRDRARYLEWVGAGRQGRLVRFRDASALYLLLKSQQPQTMPLLGAALARGLRRPGRRGYACLDDEGGCLGAVVLRRWMPTQWASHIVVLDPAAAPLLGELIDRSVATVVQGFAPDIERVRPFLSRWQGKQELTAATLAPGFEWPDPPPGVRKATKADVPAVTRLAWDQAPHSLRSRWLLRRRITEAVAEGLVVAEFGRPRRVVGYAALENRTPEYDQWAHIVVDSEFRGRGLGWDLVAGAAALTSERGAGAFVTVLATNPMVVPPTAALPDAFVHVTLRRQRAVIRRVPRHPAS